MRMLCLLDPEPGVSVGLRFCRRQSKSVPGLVRGRCEIALDQNRSKWGNTCSATIFSPAMGSSNSLIDSSVSPAFSKTRKRSIW
jgi:hypothetical protein